MDLNEESTRGRLTRPASIESSGCYEINDSSIKPNVVELIDYIGILEDYIADSHLDIWDELDFKDKIWKSNNE